MPKIKNLKRFVLMCLANPGLEYELFEDECTEELRDLIYSLADQESPEPFRSAMINIGFTEY